jgi:DNA-binding PadR family transcriptional regulator
VINLTPTSYIVLGMLDAAGEATPYDLKRMVAATVGNFFRLPHSQIYSEPERLAKAGYLREKREASGRRRKHYSLTQKGRQALEEWVSTPTAELYELRDPGLLKLGFGTDPKKLAEVQLESHKRRLAELEELLEQFKVAGAPEPQRLVIEAGVGHEREYVRFWSRVARRN